MGARAFQDEDEDEAGDEGRQAGDLRQDVRCQGEAREEGGEGFPGQGPQGQHLKRGGDACLEPSQLSVGVPRGGLVSKQILLGSRARWVLVAHRLYMLAGPRSMKKK